MIEDDRVTADHLIQKVKLKYNNMFQASRWKKTEDPSSKVISALATKVKTLELQQQYKKYAYYYV